MFGDTMRMGDAFGMKLECGHPDIEPGKVCPLCGKSVPAGDLKIEYNAGAAEPEKVGNITIEASGLKEEETNAKEE